MLQGAIVGRGARLGNVYRHWHAGALVFCVLAWYALLFLWKDSSWQIISLFPLLGVSYFLYSVASAPLFKRLYETPFLGGVLFIAGSLCLEVYLVQNYIFTPALNGIFPLNLPIIATAVFAAAYGVKFLSNLFAQTFSGKDYEFKKLFLRK